MAEYAPPPHKPDNRIFASYPMPAKIDLINERPRRESLLEMELETKIGEAVVPRLEVFENRQYSTTPVGYNNQQEPSINQQHYQQQQAMPMQSQHQPQLYSQMVPSQQGQYPAQAHLSNTSTTTTTQTIASKMAANNAANLTAELADKEAKLMTEINALHQRPYSPYQVPPKIDLTCEQKVIQQQYQNAPSPRPYSRASSTKSTTEDFLIKEAKLLQEIEEMGKKPFNPQRIVVEREQWYEYPEGRPNNMQLMDSKRRVKDFCSLPSHMYPDQGTHIHEENLPASTLGRPTSSAASSVHTTIIRSPKRDINNKSPLPFAFDNFTTKGVRGNIASALAIEPDRPRAPIYPIMKRSPSPNMARM